MDFRVVVSLQLVVQKAPSMSRDEADLAVKKTGEPLLVLHLPHLWSVVTWQSSVAFEQKHSYLVGVGRGSRSSLSQGRAAHCTPRSVKP